MDSPNQCFTVCLLIQACGRDWQLFFRGLRVPAAAGKVERAFPGSIKRLARNKFSQSGSRHTVCRFQCQRFTNLRQNLFKFEHLVSGRIKKVLHYCRRFGRLTLDFSLVRGPIVEKWVKYMPACGVCVLGTGLAYLFSTKCISVQPKLAAVECSLTLTTGLSS